LRIAESIDPTAENLNSFVSTDIKSSIMKSATFVAGVFDAYKQLKMR
jgi:hypothetical protein